ncbi:MAG: outer membrane beta-barrel protein [Nitrospira sp.]|nr:outer membrane beta-barrel protein [Nitrospira sp.]
MKKILIVLMVMGLVISSGPVLAKDGFYMGMDLGIAVAPEMGVEAWDNDVSTRCDGFINNDGSGGHLVMPNEGDCTQSNRDAFSWLQQFDGGTGILAGASLGYRMRSFRVEAEYFYRGTSYDGLDNEVQLLPAGTPFQGGKEGELSYTEAGVDDVLSHNFFANLYYDYRSDSKLTPYLGVGVGFARVSLDFYNRWTRNSDPDNIPTFDKAGAEGQELANRELLNERVAGTTTIGRAKLSDTLFGYQVLAGVDYQISEPVSIGLKFRWADFGDFEDGREWDQLRSHESAVGPGGARVQYSAVTDDIQFWGVSLNMKYQF